MCKNISFADLLGSQKLLEILQIPHTVKDSENLVKSGCFEKCLGWEFECQIFFEMKEGYDVPVEKILIFC